jgi:WD40 repeat protein
VVTSPDGTVVFAVGSLDQDSTSLDWEVRAYVAATGATLWTAGYDGPVHGADFANDIAVSPDGSRVFVTGYSTGDGTGLDAATLCLDAATSQTVWVRRFDGPAHEEDVGRAIAASPDGSLVFVTGSAEARAGYPDYVTIGYEAATGSPAWIKRYDGPNHTSDLALDLAVAPDGTTVFVTGASSSSSLYDYATAAYDARTGAAKWLRRFAGPDHGDDEATAVAVSADGLRVVVTGFSSFGATAADYMTIAYDTTAGTTVWRTRFVGFGNFNDVAYDVAVSPDGALVFVTGESDNGGWGDYGTIAYDLATGTVVWQRTYDGPNHEFDSAGQVAVSPDGSAVFVTGQSDGGASRADIATIAYWADTGAFQWLQRFNGPFGSGGVDVGYGLAVAPDGSAVFVEGISEGNGTGLDMMTLAYDVGQA